MRGRGSHGSYSLIIIRYPETIKSLKSLETLKTLKTLELYKKGLSTLAGNNPGDIWTMLHSNLEKKTKDCLFGSYNIIEGK